MGCYFLIFFYSLALVANALAIGVLPFLELELPLLERIIFFLVSFHDILDEHISLDIIAEHHILAFVDVHGAEVVIVQIDVLEAENFGELEAVKLQLSLLLAFHVASHIESLLLFFVVGSSLRRDRLILFLHEREELVFLRLIQATHAHLHIGNEELKVVAHEIKLGQQPTVLDDCHLVDFVNRLDLVVIVDECVNEIIGVSVLLHHVLGVEILIDAVRDHALAYSIYMEAGYVISFLLSFRFSFDIMLIHFASSVILFFSAALMIRKLRTMFRFFSSSFIKLGMS